MKINIKQLNSKSKSRTAEIKINGMYFLSSFHDRSGAIVRVLDKSTKRNRAGFNSTVTVVVVESVDDPYYKTGAVHTCNATNLYESRELASPQNKYKALE